MGAISQHFWWAISQHFLGAKSAFLVCQVSIPWVPSLHFMGAKLASLVISQHFLGAKIIVSSTHACAIFTPRAVIIVTHKSAKTSTSVPNLALQLLK